MSEPRDPKEPQDPLRSLFREAGEFGQALTAPDTASSITRRGMRAQRRRMAVVAVGVCLVVGGGGAVAVGLLPVRPQPVAPATNPSPSYPSPVPSEGLPTEQPSTPPSPSTTVPGSAGTRGRRGRRAGPPSRAGRPRVRVRARRHRRHRRQPMGARRRPDAAARPRPFPSPLLPFRAPAALRAIRRAPTYPRGAPERCLRCPRSPRGCGRLLSVPHPNPGRPSSGWHGSAWLPPIAASCGSIS